jgi:hypothetical protein
VLDAVVGGDSDDVHGGDALLPQPRGHPRPVFGGAFETAVGSLVGALVEDGIDGSGVYGGEEVRVEVGALGAGHAVHGPGGLEVGGVGEMVPGVDVVVAGCHDVLVPGLRRALDQVTHLHGDLGATCHGDSSSR